MKKYSLKDISYLELWQLFRSAEQNHLCNFRRECYEEQFCEIIMNLGQWVKKRCRLKDFLSGALWQPSCLVEQNRLCNFERGHHREHTCEDI